MRGIFMAAVLVATVAAFDGMANNFRVTNLVAAELRQVGHVVNRLVALTLRQF